MTTEEVKNEIERLINKMDNLKKELTTMIFENLEIIEEDEVDVFPTPGYIGVYAVHTDSKVLRFAVNESGWLTTYDNYLMGVTEMPCIKNFVIFNENKYLKRKVDELEEALEKLVKFAN